MRPVAKPMAFSDRLLEDGSHIWEAQLEHPFVTELAAGTLDEAAFEHWVKQDYRYLLDYARLFSVAGSKARDEETMTHLLGVAHEVLDHEMDLHREFAADYGISQPELESVERPRPASRTRTSSCAPPTRGRSPKSPPHSTRACRATSTSPSTWRISRRKNTSTRRSSRCTPVRSSARRRRGAESSSTSVVTATPANTTPCARRF